MDQKTKNIIIIVSIVALVLIAVVVVVASTGKTKTVTKGPTSETTPGVASVFCQFFPKYCGSGTGSGYDIRTCDCQNPGYTKEGDYTPSCSELGDQYMKDCK